MHVRRKPEPRVAVMLTQADRAHWAKMPIFPEIEGSQKARLVQACRDAEAASDREPPVCGLEICPGPDGMVAHQSDGFHRAKATCQQPAGHYPATKHSPEKP